MRGTAPRSLPGRVSTRGSPCARFQISCKSSPPSGRRTPCAVRHHENWAGVMLYYVFQECSYHERCGAAWQCHRNRISCVCTDNREYPLVPSCRGRERSAEVDVDFLHWTLRDVRPSWFVHVLRPWGFPLLAPEAGADPPSDVATHSLPPEQSAGS